MFTAKIITPSGDTFEREVERLSVPTTDGTRTLLAHHIDAVMPIREGEVRFIGKREQESVRVSDGIFQFSDNTARVFVHKMIEPTEDSE